MHTIKNAIANSVIQSITFSEYLLYAPDGEYNDCFGMSVDIDGDAAVVGVPYDGLDGFGFAGTACVFERISGNWIHTATLRCSTTIASLELGYSVAIEGDTIAVGAPGYDDFAGCAFIFTKPAGGWADATESAILLASDPFLGASFGTSIDLSSDTVVVGSEQADGIDSITGAAYVFEKPVGGWADATETGKLYASDGWPGERFAISLSIYGDTVVAGALDNFYGPMTGSAYVFVKPVTGWTDTMETAKLNLSNPNDNDEFGKSVDIYEDTIVVGSRKGFDPLMAVGAAYVFEKPTGGWISMTETAELTASNFFAYAEFGAHVSITEDFIFIGHFLDDDRGNNCGSVYVYKKPFGGWTSTTETGFIYASDASPEDYLGWSIEASGNRVIAGAAYDDVLADMSGSAYIFEITTEDENAVLSLLPTDINVYRCEEREITVHLSEADGVVGYRIVLNYDPAQVTYVSGSATITGTDCEGGWFGGIVNDASPGQVIFTSASLGGPLPAGPATLVKFTFKVNCVLPDFEAIDITFDETLTNLNDGAIAVTNEPWAGEVNGPNIPPSFTPGSDINILEDFGPYSSLWATDITSGTDYEDAYQSVWFEITSNSNPGLFGVAPAIDAAGILTFTPADDAFGLAELEIVLHDDGGTANGGSDVSPAHTLTIIVTPVNDPPSFTILSATAVALNESVGLETILNFASDVSPGPANESSQDILFSVGVDHTELFAVEPAINSAGTMVFGPAAGAHGVANATVILQDNGGTDNGGVDLFGPQTFVIKIYLPYQWGELSADGIVGAVDAWNALLYYVGLIDEFPAYPPADYPEYYPGGVASSAKFPPAGDVNWDGVLAALDASLILQQFALLIDSFPADLNQDDWGPDAFYPGDSVFQWAKRAGARRASYDPRRLIASVEPTWEGWRVSFSLDRTEDVLGFRVGLKYNPNCLSVDKNAIQLGRKDGLLVINDSQPGALILSGAFLKEFPDGMHELLDLEFIQLKDAEFDEAFVITIDPSLTNVNDGHIDLDPACLKPFNLDEFN